MTFSDISLTRRIFVAGVIAREQGLHLVADQLLGVMDLLDENLASNTPTRPTLKVIQGGKSVAEQDDGA